MAGPLVTKILHAVADAEGVEPTALDVRLQDHVDTDAIRLLEAHDGGRWTLTIHLPDHDVTVTSDGVVHVDGDTPRIHT